jgi:hypothetical protein
MVAAASVPVLVKRAVTGDLLSSTVPILSDQAANVNQCRTVSTTGLQGYLPL